MPKRGDLKLMDEQRLTTLCQNISQGMPFTFAARLCGIGDTTFFRVKADAKKWASRGRPPRGKLQQFYAMFLEKLGLAESQAIQRNVGLIQIAAKDNWTAAAWWLERTYPEYFARKTIVKEVRSEVRTEERVVEKEMDLSHLSNDEVRQLESLMARASSGPPVDPTATEQ